MLIIICCRAEYCSNGVNPRAARSIGRERCVGRWTIAVQLCFIVVAVCCCLVSFGRVTTEGRFLLWLSESLIRHRAMFSHELARSTRESVEWYRGDVYRGRSNMFITYMFMNGLTFVALGWNSLSS